MSDSPRPSWQSQNLVTFLIVSVLIGVLMTGLLMPAVAAGAAGVRAMSVTLENLPAELETPPQAERTTVRMADGTRLATFYDENRVYVPLDEIAPVMQQAQLAIEDHRFYEHGAIDVRGTLRAFLSNSAGGATQGASSITQQYVKMVQIETAVAKGDEEGVRKAQEKSYARKVQEMRYAAAVEQKLSKDEILERYLNIAYYGDGAYGVEAASRHYFNKKAADLELHEAALLAGLVQSPDAYNPRANPEGALERRNVVLDRFAEVHPERADDVAAAKEETFDPEQISPLRNGCASSRHPFVCDYVRHELLLSPSLGETVEDRESMLDRGGLDITVTINHDVQQQAEDAVANMVGAKDPALGAVAMMEPGTGRVRAMAQSRPDMGSEEGQTYYNYSVTESMGGAEGYQAGSTFKIYSIAAAMERGMSPGTSYPANSPMEFGGSRFVGCQGPFTLGGQWTVRNSTTSAPSMNLQQATNMSVNTYFVQLIRDAGICNSAKMAEKTGVRMANGDDLSDTYGETPSFVLGVAEVTPLSMAESMATFAAGGVHCEPVIISSIKTGEGNELGIPTGNCKRVMDAEAAEQTNRILSGVVSSGTGRPAAIPGGYPQAGKTGTTDNNASVWFVGYTPELAGASMIAVDKTHEFWEGRSRTSLKGLYLPDSGKRLAGSGGGDAGQMYKRAMAAGLEGEPRTGFGSANKNDAGEMTDLPKNLAGMEPNKARQTLERAGFTVAEQYIYSDKPQGTYLGTSPEEEAPEGSRVYLTFSAGPPPQAATGQVPTGTEAADGANGEGESGEDD